MGMLEDLLAGAVSGRGMGQAPQPRSGGMGGLAGSGALVALLLIVVAMLANRGGLGDILGQVLGGGAAPGGAGGLGGLLEKLNQGGYAQHAQSWVGSGQNMTIPSGAIRDVFGQRGLAAIAQQAGLSEDETSDGLAQLLPEVVNHVTPQGHMPQGDELESTLQGLLQKLAR